jgi:DNA polymerase II large subunit
VCGGELLPTVFEGAVRKYLGLSQQLAATPGVTPYVRQRIQILEASLETLFPREAPPMPLEGYAPSEPDPPPEGVGPGEAEPAPSQPPNTERPLPPTAGL